MRSLLVVERFVLEALGEGKKSLDQIREETQLNELFLKNILSGLVYKNIVIYQNTFYSIDENQRKEIVKHLNQKENIKGELKELFVSMVNEFFQNEVKTSYLHVKKISMNSFEEKIFDSHLKNLNDFMASLGQREGEKVSKKKVVIWGSCNYLNLVNSSLCVL